jgi:tetratricopeptide (TPR) repeat protein
MNSQQQAQMLQGAQAVLAEGEPTEEWTHLLLAAMHEQDNRPAEAQKAYEKAIAIDPESSTAYLAYAYFLESRGDFDDAVEKFRQLRLVAADEGWAQIESAHFYRRHGHLEEAITHYLAAVDFNDDDPLWHTYLAETYFEDGQVEKALDSFEDAVAANENNGNYYVYAQYGRTLFEMGDFAGAATLLKEALERQPNEYAIMLILGQTYEKMAEPENARAIYERIIAMDRDLTQELIQQARDLLAALP